MLRGLLGTFSLWAVGAIVLRAVVVPAQVCPAVSAEAARAAAHEAAAWVERVQHPDGTYVYEFDGREGLDLGGYNTVRHAGVTMGLYLLAAGGDASGLAAGDRGLEWMRANLLRRDGWAALRDPYTGGVELGASALMLAGLAQRRIATGDPVHDELMREVGRFLLVQQRADGSMLSDWLPGKSAPDPVQVSRYATGEAFWALTLMHRVFPAEGWDRPARAIADYLSLQRDRVEKNKYPPWADQWAAYGLAEMADWGLTDDNIRYARSLAERFGFLMRVESARRDSWWSELLRGRRARAAGMGTWVEGLDSLYRLATSDARMADMRAKIGERAVCGAGMLADRQFSESKAARYTNPAFVRGAWFTNDVTRMDDQQHALSALANAAPIIAREAGR